MIIYKATCLINKKNYIGQTSQTLQQRINQHNYKAFNTKDNSHFHNAIRKYGIENFKYEIIESNIKTQEELNAREKYWIQYFNSFYAGYNSTIGGDGSVKRDDDWIEYLFLEGKTTQEICQITGYHRSTVYRGYKERGLIEENNKRKVVNLQVSSSKEVLQYDINGNFIKEWPSATSCKEIGQQSAISSVCRQEQYSAYGYLWKYKNDPRDISEWVENYKNKQQSGRPKKKIRQLDLNGNEIKIYNSASEAAKALNKQDKTNICAAARKNKKAYGYYWEYI